MQKGNINIFIRILFRFNINYLEYYNTSIKNVSQLIFIYNKFNTIIINYCSNTFVTNLNIMIDWAVIL